MHKLRMLLFAVVLLLSSTSFTREARAAGIIVNPNQVYSYATTEADIQKLKKAYPNLIQVKVIGKSEYGRNIYAVGLGTGPAKTFINGAHHAREWMTTNLTMYMINQYAAAAVNNTLIDGFNARYILSTTTIWFVPMVNPDGVTLQQQGLKAFPKSLHASLIKMNEGSTNFKRWKANAKGIDLNRQYNAGWSAIKSPKSPRYKDFKGYAPESAVEAKAIVKFTNDINPEMAVAYHSSGKILYWNYNLAGSRYTRDHTYAKKIGEMTGYKLIYPQWNPSGGGFTDWFINSKKKPGFTPEISKPVYETSPPLSEFPGAWKENRAVGLYVAQESANLYYKRVYASLVPKYQNLQLEARKLKTYYYSNIKSAADLKVIKAHSDAYAKVNSQNNSLAAQAGKLPSRFRKQLVPYQDEIRYHLIHSANFINGIKAGEALIPIQTSLKNKLTAGDVSLQTVSLHKKLTQMIGSSSSSIVKMYSPTVRNLALNKYILPAKITKENTVFEIDRATLTTEIEKQLKPENLNLVKGSLAKLEQLEISQADLKKRGNSLHPGKYYTFPKTEAVLLTRKKAIKDWIAATEAAAAAAAKPEAETPQNKEPDSSAEIEKEPAQETKTGSEPKTVSGSENEGSAESSDSQSTPKNGN